MPCLHALLGGGLAVLAPVSLPAQNAAPAEVAARLRLDPRHPIEVEPAGRSLAMLPDTVIRKRKGLHRNGGSLGALIGSLAR